MLLQKKYHFFLTFLDLSPGANFRLFCRFNLKEKKMSEAIVSVRDLNKSYGTFHAVKDLNFQVVTGEVFGLLGPNGAGKSTTLSCILGTCKADSGQMKVLGYSGEKIPKKLFNQIGIQFQDSSYPDRIRVDELCQMITVLYRDTSDWREMLELFRLDSKIKSHVSGLSGGEKQKLALLLALINKPRIVFLDELTTGLDPEARHEVWNYLSDLKEQGMTIVLTSHYMEEVERLCDRVMIIGEGRELVSGTVGELLDRSGTTSMNDAYLYYVKGETANEETVNIDKN